MKYKMTREAWEQIGRDAGWTREANMWDDIKEKGKQALEIGQQDVNMENIDKAYDTVSQAVGGAADKAGEWIKNKLLSPQQHSQWDSLSEDEKEAAKKQIQDAADKGAKIVDMIPIIGGFLKAPAAAIGGMLGGQKVKQQISSPEGVQQLEDASEQMAADKGDLEQQTSEVESKIIGRIDQLEQGLKGMLSGILPRAASKVHRK